MEVTQAAKDRAFIIYAAKQMIEAKPYLDFSPEHRSDLATELRRVGLTTARVAEVLKIAPATAQRWYSGARNFPSWAKQVLADIYTEASIWGSSGAVAIPALVKRKNACIRRDGSRVTLSIDTRQRRANKALSK
ncbi:MAG: hypothetical protein WC683_18610 [bacterium]